MKTLINGQDSGRVEILIVEDSPTQAKQLRDILERNGYVVIAVPNGVEALAQIDRKLPTLIISDVVMPAMNGYELCRRLKADERVRSIPVILLTSLNEPVDVVKGLECGADNFLFKPFDEKYLLARVAYVLANRHFHEMESPKMGIEIFFTGRKFFISSDRLQILNLLLSTYEAAVQKNLELSSARDELRTLNQQLEAKVRERTAALESEVAERKGAEERVEALNTALEQRVIERTAQLEAANADLIEARQEADRANRAKSEFLSRMSHELRTPMNAVLGFAQLLELDTLTPDQQNAVTHIIDGGRHLLDLINEVLDLSRIEAGKLRLLLEPIDLGEVLSETLQLVQPLAADRDIQLNPAPHSDFYIHADRQRLKQVLINLLSNAIKYNRLGGAVTIQCEEIEQRLRIVISDTGLGIPAQNITQLFAPFERLGTDQSTVEGTGLGLTVAKRLVEAMGGTIGVESVVDRGSSFWVEFSLIEGSVPRTVLIDDLHSQVESNGSDQTLTVLCIEDNVSNSELIERILSHRPAIKLIVARDGITGLNLAKEHIPAAILLDLNLPDVTGHEVLLRLKDDPWLKRVPVIMISADATPGQINRLLAAGAQGYLTKPLEVKRLLQVLDEMLQTEPSQT
jgi:signal transduction histidine kinase